MAELLDVFPPAGQFARRAGTAPLALISGGVGITPTLAMAETALEPGQRHVVFIHYARNLEVQAFKDTLEAWARNCPRFKLYLVYEERAMPGAAAGCPSLAHVQDRVPADADAHFLGPKPFMPTAPRA